MCKTRILQWNFGHLFKRKYIPVSNGFNFQIKTIFGSNIIRMKIIWFLVFKCHFQEYFTYVMATSFSGGRSRSTQKEPPTMGKQVVNLITCGWESSAPFLVIYKEATNPRCIGDRKLDYLTTHTSLTHWATQASKIRNQLYAYKKKIMELFTKL